MTISSAWQEWRLTAGLILLTLVPMGAGAFRIVQITGGAPVTPDNQRFFDMPVPVIAHIIGASLYVFLGAFQFNRGFRRRRPGWHRISGRLLVPCGLVAALTGLWMSTCYQLPAHDGPLLYVFRVFFGVAMAGSIVVGFRAVLRRDIVRHRVWMTRGYAIGLGAGTQVLTNAPWQIIVGPPGPLTRALLMGAGWVINLAVAEWYLRRRPARALPRTPRSDLQPASRLT
jgi:predicted membrane protein DUF2306